MHVSADTWTTIASLPESNGVPVSALNITHHALQCNLWVLCTSLFTHSRQCFPSLPYAEHFLCTIPGCLCWMAGQRALSGTSATAPFTLARSTGSRYRFFLICLGIRCRASWDLYRDDLFAKMLRGFLPVRNSSFCNSGDFPLGTISIAFMLAIPTRMNIVFATRKIFHHSIKDSLGRGFYVGTVLKYVGERHRLFPIPLSTKPYGSRDFPQWTRPLSQNRSRNAPTATVMASSSHEVPT